MATDGPSVTGGRAADVGREAAARIERREADRVAGRVVDSADESPGADSVAVSQVEARVVAALAGEGLAAGADPVEDADQAEDAVPAAEDVDPAVAADDRPHRPLQAEG